MKGYVAERLVAIYRDPSPVNMEELLALSLLVERMETFIDGLVAESAAAEHTLSGLIDRVNRL